LTCKRSAVRICHFPLIQTFSNLSFRVLASEIEGMIPKVISLLFFAFFLSMSVSGLDYVVQKGDSAVSIAQKEKVPADLLTKVNPNQDWDQLKAGDHLFVPERYVVKNGDTLYSLCRLWLVDQAEVMSLNRLSGPSLRSGQVLFIPAKVKTQESPLFWPVSKAPHAESDKLKSVTFATTGEPFRSVSAGTVVYQGEFRGAGRVLLVQSADKSVFAYGNFESSAVDFGQAVAKGQVLGITSPRPSQKLSFFAFRQDGPLDVFSVKR
jgi:LysM repeat protein